MDNENKTLKLLYGGSSLLGGSLGAICSFTANRFQLSECMLIIAGGILAGVGFGLMCHAIITLLKK